MNTCAGGLLGLLVAKKRVGGLARVFKAHKAEALASAGSSVPHHPHGLHAALAQRSPAPAAAAIAGVIFGRGAGEEKYDLFILRCKVLRAGQLSQGIAPLKQGYLGQGCGGISDEVLRGKGMRQHSENIVVPRPWSSQSRLRLGGKEGVQFTHQPCAG